MCGIAGVIAAGESKLVIEPKAIDAMRDRLAHRGPDDAMTWRGAHAAIGFRRLAIRDTSEAGRQPMLTSDGRYVLAFNGEIYNDAELRRELGSDGVVFRSGCDAETLLTLLERYGVQGLQRVRGMFAVAWYDTLERTLWLARDPLGIKPMYWAGCAHAGQRQLAFASEPPALFEHPGIEPRPDPVMISAYLTTIRTVLGERTMFDGVRAVEPGIVLRFDLGRVGTEPSARQRLKLPTVESDDVAALVTESVRRHLVSDVPTSCLLSGGLDSSAVCSVAADESADALRTFCAGATDAAPINGVPQSDDFVFAREVAEHLSSAHTEVPVDEADFVACWGEMVGRLGVPLSTPNEVAIWAVATAVRTSGCPVTLSGEGADELFGGYEPVMRSLAAHVAAGDEDPGAFHVLSNAWVHPADKAAVLRPVLFAEAAGDAWLMDWYRGAHAAASEATDDPMAAHLGVLRRVNLVGLLGRLDTATMLASVEGRTPLADVAVAAVAERLPMSRKFAADGETVRTKIALREAFANALPASVVHRPKASFPLPFQRWMQGAAGVVAESEVLREWLSPAAIATVVADPAGRWNLAWPASNLAMWAERWWGGRRLRADASESIALRD